MVLSGNEETALRLGAALLVGTVLGLNRELHGKPAGLRTHALVSLGAALAVIMVLRSADGSLAADQNAVSRVVQGILTGVGFLGAGVILHDPNGHISGLTTAATIWICAVLGLVCGLGHWVILGTALFLIVLALIFGRPLERLTERLFKRHASSPPDHSV
jgi:putative Mg2+ transporter-C (MgtC) family protein